MIGPSLAEPNVGYADGPPCEKSSETRQGDEPVENGFSGRCHVHVAQTSPKKNECDREKGTSRAIDIGEDLGSITLISERSQSTRATVDTGNTDRYDRDHDDDVHEAVEAHKPGIFTSNDEGGCVGAVTFSTEKAFVIGSN